MKCIYFEYHIEDLPDSGLGQIFYLSGQCDRVPGYPHLEIGDFGDGVIARIYTIEGEY